MEHQISSLQTTIRMRSTALLETSCGYLLQELQMIWDEVGEDQFEREKVLLDLEQECLEVYRRKVDTANISRAHLHQELAEAEAEFTHLLLSLGERSLPGRPEKMTGTLKEQLDSITPALREMRLRKEERMNQFQAVQGQIQKISAEIAGQSEYDNSSSTVIVNENDLSLKKLEEYQIELQRLRNEKNERLQRVEKYIGKIHNLTAILGMDSSMIITKVHPSLNELSGMSKNISDSILAKLKSTVESLEEEKQKRLEKLRQLGRALKNLWNLMDTPSRERHSFYHVTDLLLVSSEVSDPGSLTPSIIQQAEAEVKRLDQLKSSKMKELFHKKQNELEEICNKSHMEIPSQSEMDNITNLIKTGEIDHADLLMSMDEQISRAKEEASSRKAIMEKVEKWMLARDEERWLEEYNRDENRYSVSRGAHKNLRRAERARITVNKIPALVDLLTVKTKSWEEERKKVFLYDEVPLLAMLEEYNMFRLEKEEEKQRQRENKKVQSQVVVEQENLFVSRPGTSSRRLSNGSLNGGFTNAVPLNRRVSLGIQHLGSNSINSATQGISFIKEGRKVQGEKMFARPSLAHLRDETASVVSTFSGPLSP
ncbi:65-kDa microtubule-associated protein 8-like [Quercus lobata]|uniref:65-kDa microtubule-associated protein 8 n=1 Tax=Quercus lobata TaxID=97700 RepID=A0A7N2L7N5_QUELO|nr:65-kDa microtubule-associated protein 8-like [Quercus lobata]XP_030960580.1 65-kDa microtubule-associated protein 8-like [Quercus lobata]XP_030960605.1 65-kDa microtubule-associated protein 8-like [Quercus lobata]